MPWQRRALHMGPRVYQQCLKQCQSTCFQQAAFQGFAGVVARDTLRAAAGLSHMLRAFLMTSQSSGSHRRKNALS